MMISLVHNNQRVWMLGLVILTGLLWSSVTQAQVDLYPRPSTTVPASSLHTVRINGQSAFVYAVKINPTPNHQDVQAPASMLPFGLIGGSATVEVTLPSAPSSVVVRPTGRGITPVINGNKVTFNITEPGNFSVEFNNSKSNPLFLFANPPEVNPPTQSSANVIYFGPGVHNPGRITLQSNQTLYLAPGAYVNGYVWSENTNNIKIEGRGILSGELYQKGQLLNPNNNSQKLVEIRNARNVNISGIIALDSPEWNFHPHNSSNVTFDNIKTIGWRRNSDSIDPTNAVNLTIRHSFLKGHDDGITLKGRIIPSNPTIQNVLVEGTVHWQNWMRALVVGGELADISLIQNIRFRNIDIIHSGYNASSPENRDAAMSVWNMDNATVRDVEFENIRVEYADRLIRLNVSKNEFSQTTDYGRIRDITFKDITSSGGNSAIEITGYGPDNLIENITLNNVRINGKTIRRPDDANYIANAFVRNVKFVSDTGTVTAIYTDPFDRDMAEYYNTSAGRVGLNWRGNFNGVSTRLVDGSAQATLGRYDSGAVSQGAALTRKESVGTFADYQTVELSAFFIYVDGNNTSVNLAGLGLSDRNNGVLATGTGAAGRNGFDIVLRSDASTTGKNAVLQISNIIGNTSADQGRNNSNQVTLSNFTWYQLVASITRTDAGLFDITAQLLGRGGNGLGTPVLLLTQQLLGVSNAGIGSMTDLFAGLGMYARSSSEHGMQAVDQFWVLGSNPIPEPTSLVLLGLGTLLLSRRRR